jgi:aminoglycoside phosphotransferase (APT) family kinase protein
VALVHGDVGPANIIVDRAGRLVLLDWELFGKGAVAWDMRALVPYERRKVKEVLREVGSPGDLDPDLQLRIVAAVELGRLRQRWDGALRYYAGFGMSPARALERAEARAAGLVEQVKGGDGKPKDNAYFDR